MGVFRAEAGNRKPLAVHRPHGGNCGRVRNRCRLLGRPSESSSSHLHHKCQLPGPCRFSRDCIVVTRVLPVGSRQRSSSGMSRACFSIRNAACTSSSSEKS